MNQPTASRMRWVALFALTGINLLNYIDRYIFSALLPAIKADLQFTDTELGILGSAFLLAYTFASPIFGFIGDRHARSKTMAYGVGLWSAATAGSGIFHSFSGQLATRALVGLGESAYSVIAPSSIADYFSRQSRGMIFAIYSGAIPVGSALGYVIGGKLESAIGWQKSFFVVGIPGILLAILLYFLPDPKRGTADQGVRTGHATSIKDIYKGLLNNGGYMMTVLGYTAYTFVVGGLAFWMPSYLVRYFSVSLETANVQFGTLTVAGGFVGTFIGGWWADRIEKKTGNGFLKISVLSAVLSVPLFFYALSLKDYRAFMTSLFFLEVALFMCISPLDAAVVNYVRPAWRSSAMAFTVFLIHVLGDGISRTLMGWISDSSDLHTAILLLPYVLIIAAVFWAIGVLVFWQPLAWPKNAFVIPRWQAHRGSRPTSSVQENTLEAFRLARKAGAEMVECDTHVTRDQKAIVFHDADLKRLANREEKVRELTAEQIQSYTPAPLLEEMLRDPDVPKLINIELKTASVFKGEGLEEAVVKAVRETNSSDRVMFSSFNPFALRRLAKLAPEIPRALLVTEYKDASNKGYLRRMLLGAWAMPHLVHADVEMVTPERLEKWEERSLPIVVWTVNDAAKGRALLESGVRSVISDTIYKD